MKQFRSIVFLAILGCSMVLNAYARDAARDLRKIVGFTIIAAETVDEVFEKSGEKRIKLGNGLIFSVDSLSLDPLVLTDVIVFAKRFPDTLVAQYKGKLPERFFYSYKLLIDNELYDATPK